MDNSISNISFGAKIITPLKGNFNVMDRVAKKFEQRTADMDGFLRVVKDGGTGVSVSLNDKKNVVFHDSSDLLLTNVKDDRVVTDKIIDRIVDKFINVYKALGEYVKYDELKASYKNQVDMINNSKEMDNKTEIMKLFSVLDNVKKSQNDFRQKLDEIVKDEPKLTIWKYQVLNKENFL